MRIFGAERLDAMLTKLGFQEGETITHPWVNRAVEKAQERVEARNCDIHIKLRSESTTHTIVIIRITAIWLRYRQRTNCFFTNNPNHTIKKRKSLLFVFI